MADPLYEVTFVQPGDGHRTLKVREVSDSGLGPMFVRLSGFVFESGGTIINPVDDQMRTRYEKTKSLHVNRMSLLVVEEIEGPAIVLTQDGANVVPFRPPHDGS